MIGLGLTIFEIAVRMVGIGGPPPPAGNPTYFVLGF